MSFVSELKRRNVVRVFLVYVLAAVAVVEAADVLFPRLTLPDWTVTLVVALAVVGLPVALVLAWAYELTPEGLRPERREGAATAAAPETPRARQGSGSPSPPAPGAAGPARPAPDPPDKSIAVLAFADMSAEGDQEYFGDGVAEEIIDALTKLEDLRVAARTSSFAFKGRGEDVREIGRRLGVGAVLEGSIRKSGSRLRITAQLVSVADGYHLWSERYEREMDDVFAIQDDIARAVVQSLRVRLLGSEGSLVHATTWNARAYDLYLKGRWAWRRRYELGLDAAMEHFRQAIALDPEFAEPHAGITDTYSVMAIYGFGNDDEVARGASEAVGRALALGPEIPDVRFAAGLYELVFGWSAPRALEHFGAAIRSAGRHPRSRAWLGLALVAQGHGERALEESRGAVAEAPDSSYLLSVHGLVCLGARAFVEAREVFTHARQLEPSDLISRYGLGLTESVEGNHDQALEHLRYVYDRGGAVGAFSSMLAGALARAGRMREAEDIVDRVASRRSVVRMWVAAEAGRAADFFEAMDRVIEARIPGLLAALWVPGFWPMRSDRRWSRLDPFLHGEGGTG